jgi:hypothetical protein
MLPLSYVPAEKGRVGTSTHRRGAVPLIRSRTTVCRTLVASGLLSKREGCADAQDLFTDFAAEIAPDMVLVGGGGTGTEGPRRERQRRGSGIQAPAVAAVKSAALSINGGHVRAARQYQPSALSV